MSHSFDLYLFLTAPGPALAAGKEYIDLAVATAAEEDSFVSKIMHRGGAGDEMPETADPAFVRGVAYHGNIQHRLQIANIASSEFFKARRRQCASVRELGLGLIAVAQQENELLVPARRQPAMQKQDREQRELDAQSREQ